VEHERAEDHGHGGDEERGQRRVARADEAQEAVEDEVGHGRGHDGEVEDAEPDGRGPARLRQAVEEDGGGQHDRGRGGQHPRRRHLGREAAEREPRERPRERVGQRGAEDRELREVRHVQRAQARGPDDHHDAREA
jgi:hypothetical protein